MADRLLDVTRRVSALPPDLRARYGRRLAAITDAAKHDLGRTGARLDALVADLDAEPSPDPGAGTP